jgi:hypothetical protein
LRTILGRRIFGLRAARALAGDELAVDFLELGDAPLELVSCSFAVSAGPTSTAMLSFTYGISFARSGSAPSCAASSLQCGATRQDSLSFGFGHSSLGRPRRHPCYSSNSPLVFLENNVWSIVTETRIVCALLARALVVFIIC